MKTLIKTSPLFFILFMTVIVFSCKKDKVSPLVCNPIGNQGDYCPEMYNQRTRAFADSIHKVNNFPGCIVSPEYIMLEEYYFNEPILNPNNPFEFAFTRSTDEIGWNEELCVYNFCSNETKVLTDVVGYDIDWSAKNWILFTGKDLQLYKIKSNGDSLIQLTDTGNFNYKARWNPDGTKYLYFDADAIIHKICDENGTLIKSFSNNMAEFDWLNDEKIVFARSSGSQLDIKEYDIETGGEVLLYSQANIGSGEPIHVHEEKIYFTSQTGAYLYENGNATLFDSNYVTYSSGYPQYLTHNKVLLQRFITDTTYYPCTVYGGTYISILDLNDNTEEYVDIPE